MRRRASGHEWTRTAFAADAQTLVGGCPKRMSTAPGSCSALCIYYASLPWQRCAARRLRPTRCRIRNVPDRRRVGAAAAVGDAAHRRRHATGRAEDETIELGGHRRHSLVVEPRAQALTPPQQTRIGRPAAGRPRVRAECACVVVGAVPPRLARRRRRWSIERKRRRWRRWRVLKQVAKTWWRPWVLDAFRIRACATGEHHTVCVAHALLHHRSQRVGGQVPGAEDPPPDVFGVCDIDERDTVPVSYTHLTLPTKRIV